MLNSDCDSNHMYCKEGNCVGKFNMFNIRRQTSICIFRYSYVEVLNITYLRISKISVKEYKCFDALCRESFYGHSIKGSKDSVARECANDPDCKAFQYSSKHRTGFFCNDTDAIKSLKHDDWELCNFGSS